MTAVEVQTKLDELLALPAETEWVEFKEAKNNFDSDDLGRYFSALSNEANLKGRPFGWLIFGVKDKPREVVGTNFRPSRPSLDKVKGEVASQTAHGISFEDIYELQTTKGRVVMFQIPAAIRGLPTPWKGHWYGRHGESLGPLSLPELEQIRGQVVKKPMTRNPIRESLRPRGHFRNPYDFNHAASKEVFKGREPEIAQLLDNLSSGTHTAVFGLQRMGKTSLVEYAMTEGLQKRSDLRRELLYAKIDFQRTSYSKYRDLFDVFLRAIAGLFKSERATHLADYALDKFAKAAARPELKHRKLLFEPFAASLGELVHLAAGKKVVMFLDEFSEWCRVIDANETAATSQRGQRTRAVHPHESLVDVDLMQFFSSLLRSDDLKDRLVFIFAIRPFMAEYDHRRKLQILKLCQPITLYYLEEDAAKALITEPIQRFLSIESEAVDYLYRLTAGHPYLIQFMLKMTVDECVRVGGDRIKVQQVDAVEQRMVSEGSAFDAVFKVLDSDYSIEDVLASSHSARGKGLLSLVAKLSTDCRNGWAEHRRVADAMAGRGCRREETDGLLDQLVKAKILEEGQVDGRLCFRMAVLLLQKRYLKQNFYLKYFQSVHYR